MKIVVCVKQVPGTLNVDFDPETHRLARGGTEAILNPFDTYALEQGILVKEALGGEVIALSMGPSTAENTIRESIACGADSGVLVSDTIFEGSDTWATSYILSKAIEKIGDVDLILCGKQSSDGETAQVGAGIAQHLGWPQAAFVSAMPEMKADSIVVRRMFESGFDECQVKLPAVVTVVKDINSPRIPSLRSKMASKKAEIPIWDAAELGASEEFVGLAGSPTRVTATERAPKRDSVTVILDGSATENAKSLVSELRKKSLV